MELYTRTLGDWLEHWAEATPDKEYIVYSDRNLRFTWRQFNERVDNMAKGLLAIGVKRNTHVGIGQAMYPTGSLSCMLAPNRCCSCNRKHQLQASRTGISLSEFRYAYVMYRQR